MYIPELRLQNCYQCVRAKFQNEARRSVTKLLNSIARKFRGKPRSAIASHTRNINRFLIINEMLVQISTWLNNMHK